MDIFIYIIALVLAFLGVVGSIFPVVPGTILSAAALAIGYFGPTKVLTIEQMIIWILISLLVTIVDMFLPILVTKRMGGSKSGVIGATLGLIFGFIAFPPFGIIVGPFVGAVMGELINNRDDVANAFKLGFGSFVAFLLGTGLKFTLSVAVLWILFQAMYAPVADYFASVMDKITFLQ